MTTSNPHQPFWVYLLVFFCIVLGGGGLYGGSAFITDPTGASIGMDVSLLRGFLDTFLPFGIVLLLAFGLAPLGLAYALLARPCAVRRDHARDGPALGLGQHADYGRGSARLDGGSVPHHGLHRLGPGFHTLPRCGDYPTQSGARGPAPLPGRVGRFASARNPAGLVVTRSTDVRATIAI